MLPTAIILCPQKNVPRMLLKPKESRVPRASVPTVNITINVYQYPSPTRGGEEYARYERSPQNVRDVYYPVRLRPYPGQSSIPLWKSDSKS